MQPETLWVEQLARAGNNRFGEPNFRIVWGPERLEWLGGLHCDYDANGLLIRRSAEMRRVPRYSVEKPRWIVEAWLPPELYGTPDRWVQETRDAETGLLTMGPFPSRGEYEQCFTFEDEKGKPYQPNTAMLEILVNCIVSSRGISMKLRASAIKDRLARNEEKAKKLAHDIAEDAMPAFRGAMFAGDSKKQAATATSKVPLVIVPGMGRGLIQLPINKENN